MTATSDDYVLLVTNEHRDRPIFSAVVRALTQAMADAVNVTSDMPDVHFDLDQAVGAQLDAIGLWVGLRRAVTVPLVGVYFSWDDTAAIGWDSGAWKGEFDPSTGIVNLDDDTYRSVLRAKIAANRWDGTVESKYEFWDYVFGPGVIFVQDNMDMSITLYYDRLRLTAAMESLLLNGAYPLKPSGVRVNYVGHDGPMFAWDRNLPNFQGWNGLAVWV